MLNITRTTEQKLLEIDEDQVHRKAHQHKLICSISREALSHAVVS